ncbi:MAG: hypothetical protein HRF49_02650 [bacterium]
MTSSGEAKYRIGVDVGGTFTHGVVLDKDRRLVGSAMVPTTHQAKLGVSEGVVRVLELLIERTGISIEQVDLIAHSTTQATNSILEGDVAPVGLTVIVPEAHIGFAKRLFGESAIELGEGSSIPMIVKLIKDSELPLWAETSIGLLRLFAEVPSLAIVESRGTEDPTGELELDILAEFEKEGISSGKAVVRASELSGRLGVKLRAKTAVVNAAMIPRTVETARYTREAVDRLMPGKKLMVMKSEGGVMDAQEMEKRPLSCILSGPAAGASAALHVAKISDGVFLEVGGTSTDISLILAGKVRKQPARVGGHILHTRSLDLRTVAAGGGSLLWFDKRGRARCGPRSAHIAGLKYLSFPSPEDVNRADLLKIGFGSTPKKLAEKSGCKYATAEINGNLYGITLTDAANFLGLIPESDPAYSAGGLVFTAFEAVAREKRVPAKNIAEKMIAECRERVVAAVRELAKDYQARIQELRIVGGGGGVNSIIEGVAEALGRPYEVVEHPESISAIGVAVAVSTFTHEVFADNPSEEDFSKLKSLARSELGRAGVPPDQMRCSFEYDPKMKVLRVEAEGTLRFEEMERVMSASELADRAAALAGNGSESVETVFDSGMSVAFKVSSRSPGLSIRNSEILVCLDRMGRSLLVKSGANWQPCSADDIVPVVRKLIAESTKFTDSGEMIPEMYVLSPTGILDLSSFVTERQVLAAVSAVVDDLSGKCLAISRARD